MLWGVCTYRIRFGSIWPKSILSLGNMPSFFLSFGTIANGPDRRRMVSVGHPPDRLTDREWFEVSENYNGWEYDGLGHRMFGYLRVDRGALCFCTSKDILAHEANRYRYYRYVVSYEGAGWVPANILVRSHPPNPPLVAYSPHCLGRCRTRMRVLVADDDDAMDEIERILYSPRTELMASWSSPNRGVRYPVLWHHHSSRGTVVSCQFVDRPIRDHDLRCITFLAPDMQLQTNRRRIPGTMQYA